MKGHSWFVSSTLERERPTHRVSRLYIMSRWLEFFFGYHRLLREIQKAYLQCSPSQTLRLIQLR
jgi:hypothetical protein